MENTNRLDARSIPCAWVAVHILRIGHFRCFRSTGETTETERHANGTSGICEIVWSWRVGVEQAAGALGSDTHAGTAGHEHFSYRSFFLPRRFIQGNVFHRAGRPDGTAPQSHYGIMSVTSEQASNSRVARATCESNPPWNQSSVSCARQETKKRSFDWIITGRFGCHRFGPVSLEPWKGHLNGTFTGVKKRVGCFPYGPLAESRHFPQSFEGTENNTRCRPLKTAGIPFSKRFTKP